MFKLRENVEMTQEQEDFLRKFLPRKVYGCFDLPGLGKTLEILSAICETMHEGDKALVVVPPHLVPNWLHEIEKFTYLDVGQDIDIVPYTQLGKKCLSFQEYRFVAADEAHYLKNMEANRTQYFMDYLEAHLPEFFIYATGTPITNRLPDFYTFLVMIAGFQQVTPKITVRYPTYYQFCERFCHVKSVSYGSGFKYHGMKNMEELKEYTTPWTIRRAPTLGVSMKNYTIVAKYGQDDELARAFSEFESDGTVGGVDVTVKRRAAVSKAPFTAKWAMDEFEQGSGPVVIFSDHREPVEIIYAGLVSCKYRVGKIMGGDNMSNRDEIVRKFQAGELDFIVATCGAGSTGITLTASTLVGFNDIPWIPEPLTQARNRIYRLSQTKNCRCVYIAGSRADDQIINTLQAKMRVISAALEA